MLMLPRVPQLNQTFNNSINQTQEISVLNSFDQKRQSIPLQNVQYENKHQKHAGFHSIQIQQKSQQLQINQKDEKSINLGSITVKPKTNYMQRRLKHKSYNARNPYNIHSYMNQEILFQQDKDITTEQPFQQTQNDRSNSLNTANTLYGNPKYQYLLSKMKKKQYQTDRKIMNEDNFQVQKEGFQLQGQKAKLIDNSLFQLMGQYNQEQNTFKNSQTQEDYTISETETPMENKYQTKIFVKETKLQDSFGNTLVQKQNEPTQSNLLKTPYNIPAFYMQNQSYQNQEQAIQNTYKNFQNYYPVSTSQKANSSMRDAGSMINGEDIKSTGLRSNLSFITSNSPNQLSKNGSTMMHLQPKLDHSNQQANNHSAMTNKTLNNLLYNSSNNGTLQLGKDIQNSIAPSFDQLNSGQYTMKEIQKQKLKSSHLRNTVLDGNSSKSSQLKSFEISQLQIINLKSENLKQGNLGEQKLNKATKHRQVLLLNKTMKQPFNQGDSINQSTLDQLNDLTIERNNPLNIKAIKNSQFIENKLNTDLGKDSSINEDLTGFKQANEVYKQSLQLQFYSNQIQNLNNDQQVHSHRLNEKQSFQIEGHSAAFLLDSAKNSQQNMSMSFNIQINEKPKQNSSSNSALKQDDSQNIIKSHEQVIDDKHGKYAQNLLNSFLLQKSNPYANQPLNPLTQHGDFISIQDLSTIKESEKFDKLANDIINSIEYEGDKRHFKEIRQLCLKFGLKQYKYKKLTGDMRNSIDFKSTPLTTIQDKKEKFGVKQDQQDMKQKYGIKLGDRNRRNIQSIDSQNQIVRNGQNKTYEIQKQIGKNGLSLNSSRSKNIN